MKDSLLLKLTLILLGIFGVFFLMPRLASADCDKDATCRNRHCPQSGCRPGDARFCIHPNQPDSRCVPCHNGQDQECGPGYVCRDNRCLVPTVALPTATNTPTPTWTPTPTPILTPPGPEQTTGFPQNGTQTVCQMPPVDVMFVVDTSASMRGKLDDAIQALYLFADIISKDPQNRMGLAFFDDNAHVKLEFTEDQSIGHVKSVINSLRVEDKNHLGTCLECAIDKPGGDDVYGAFNRAQTYNGRRNRRVMIILSDGQINHWLNPDGEVMAANADPQSMQRARDNAEGAIRRVHNTFQVETWVAQFGAEAFNWQWMMSLTQKYGPGSYDWEGWWLNDPNVPVGSPLQWIYYRWARDIYGGFMNIQVFDDNPKTGYICATWNAQGNCLTYKPPLAGWTVTLKRYLNNIDYGNWWAHTYYPVYRTYSVLTDSAGIARFKRMCDGAYTVYVTPKPNYLFNTLGSWVNPRTLIPFTSLQDYIWASPLSEGAQTRYFGFYRVHSVSGHIYIDRDESGTENTGDDRYPLSFNMQLSPSNGSSQTVTPPTGNYSVYNIPNGNNYTLRFLSIPGFGPKDPALGSYALTFNGINCTANPIPTGYSCIDGNIANMNFGIVDISEKPWIQTGGLDVRNDQGGITNLIPSGQACGVNQNVMLQNGNGNTSGILYTNGSRDFGPNGRASSTNWVVDGQRFFPGEALKTSYAGLTDTLIRNKVTRRPLTDYSPCANSAVACTITSTIPDGVYLANSDLILGNVNVGTKKVVILVNGHLRLDSSTAVTSGGFFMVVANRSITVARDVGRAGSYVCANTAAVTPELQGIFVANGDFTVRGFGGCPTLDRQLNIGGTVITNADATGGGSFQHQRTLCLTNSQRPVITLRPRLDLLFAAPPSILRPSTTWQEVAP